MCCWSSARTCADAIQIISHPNCLLGGWTEQGWGSGLQVQRQMRHVYITMARTPSENVCGQPHLTAQPCTHVAKCPHSATRPCPSICTGVQTAIPTQAGRHFCVLSCVEMLPQSHKRGVTGTPKLPRQCSPACVSSQSCQIPFWCNYTPVRQHRRIYPSISWMSVWLPALSRRRLVGNLFSFQLGEADALENQKMCREETPFSSSPGAGNLLAPKPWNRGIAFEAQPVVI